MLIKFFLKQFFVHFSVFFLVLSFIFASADVFLRLQLISSITEFFTIFILMLPFMVQLAVPLASSLGVLSVVSRLFVEDEIININFFKKARNDLYLSVFIYSAILLLVYVPVVTYFAPKNYRLSKQLIRQFVESQLENLSPGSFHSISNKYSVFFNSHDIIDGNSVYKDFILYINRNNDIPTVIASKTAFLLGDTIMLHDGELRRVDGSYISLFKTFSIDINNFFNIKNNPVKIDHPRFLSIFELLKSYKDDPLKFFEIHKRFSQIIWQFLLPIFSLFLIMLFSERKSNLVIVFIIAGLLYLLFYLSINLVFAFFGRGPLIFLLFYLSIALTAFGVYCLVKRYSA